MTRVTTGEFAANMCTACNSAHPPGIWVCPECGGLLQPATLSVGYEPPTDDLAHCPTCTCGPERRR